ncbi:MAG: cysteine hydrolase family protein [Planctomycetota bacterium]|jgi:nicotinamidase/pyrazinamidase
MEHAIIFVDVDTQRDFMEENGALAVPGAPEIVGNLEELTRIAQRHRIPVLATLDTHGADDPEFSQFPPHCVEGTTGCEKIEATTSSHSEIFIKSAFDVFSNPAFRERVQEINPRTAVVYGVATDYCIKDAVLGLLQIVPRVLVVEDAGRTVKAEDGARALEEMKSRGAVMITSNRVQAMLEEDGC